MIIYSVTVIIKKDTEDPWLKWMRELQIKEVMKTGYFLNWEMLKLLSPEASTDEMRYVISYKSTSLGDLNEYLQKEAPRLKKEHTDKFSGKVKALRAVYQIIPH
jgi:Domain of unknown function (DUF4286)